jgi:hypothetical protein
LQSGTIAQFQKKLKKQESVKPGSTEKYPAMGANSRFGRQLPDLPGVLPMVKGKNLTPKFLNEQKSGTIEVKMGTIPFGLLYLHALATPRDRQFKRK